ncbi:MAG: hypothetical protein IPL97_14225 [Niastella sp.]|nr:hypothetical protein [Niastella sp.]
MKNTAVPIDLFIPDILLYLTGRDKVSEIVLNTCKIIVEDKSQNVSLTTKLFKDLNFSTTQIITLMAEAGNILMVKFSYTLLYQQDDNFTIEDMGNQLWKYMVRAIKNN